MHDPMLLSWKLKLKKIRVTPKKNLSHLIHAAVQQYTIRLQIKEAVGITFYQMRLSGFLLIIPEVCATESTDSDTSNNVLDVVTSKERLGKEKLRYETCKLATQDVCMPKSL